MDEAIAEDSRVRSQGFVSANQDRAIGPRMRGCAGGAQADRTDAIVYLGFGGHFIAFAFMKTQLRNSGAQLRIAFPILASSGMSVDAGTSPAVVTSTGRKSTIIV